MLILVSPAKSLDFESRPATRKHSEPRLLDHSRELVEVMAQKAPDEIASLMSISPDLAELNFERFQSFETPFTTKNARPAILAFNGDVYQGLNAPENFSERDYTHAQKTLRILSGLYGVLRPLDLIQPYRLEMGSKVSVNDSRDLYEYWGSAITELLNRDLAESPGPRAVINLASKEYFQSVDQSQLDGRLITPHFRDRGADGEYKIIAFFAKRARGAMAAWLIQQRVSSVRKIRDFDGLGYRFDPELSSSDDLVFTRDESKPV